MKNKACLLLCFFLILFSFAIAFYLYPQMPAQMASHWNIKGEVDNYSPKCTTLFLMPLISFLILLLFWILPRVDPLKKNIQQFRSYFNVFIFLIIFFLFYVYLLTVFWNLGYRFDLGSFLLPALAILFYYASVLIKNAKRNWFIGIRTPWTLSNEKVWTKTHKLGNILFKILALITLASVFFPSYGFYVLITFAFSSVVILFVYSYLEYKKITSF